MHTVGIIILVAAGLGFASSSAVCKLGMQRGADVFRFGLAGNIVNIVLYPVLGLLVGTFAYDGASILIGLAGGLSVAVSFAFFLMAIRHGPLSIAFTVFNLSIAVPVLMSVLALDRDMNRFQLAGFVLAIAAIVFFGIGQRKADANGNRKTDAMFPVYMIFCFIFNGLFLFGFNLFKSYGQENAAHSFLMMIGIAGILFYFPPYFFRHGGRRFTKSDILYPALSSLFGAASFTMLQFAMRYVSDVILFPVANGTALLSIALFSLLFLKERANPFSVSGICLATLAVIMMSYKA